MSQLVIWFEKYFQNENIDEFTWIQDPFNSIGPSEFISTEEESLIELSCGSNLKAKFTTTIQIYHYYGIGQILNFNKR